MSEPLEPYESLRIHDRRPVVSETTPQLLGRVDQWLRVLEVPLGTLEPLTGDVSSRRYVRARFEDGSSAIVAAYPHGGSDVFDRFLRTSEILGSAGISIPAILASERTLRLMLLEDLGPETLFDLSGGHWRHELVPYYRHSLAVLARIQSLPTNVVGTLNPPLDGDLFAQELAKTWRVFLEPQGLVPDRRLTGRLRDGLEECCALLHAAPQAPCHRDFMARNLVPDVNSSRVTLLDHQDLRLGPRTYDLASLLNDSLFPHHAVTEDLLEGVLAREDRALYHRTAVQRTLKAVGTFVTFAEGGNTRHLSLVPQTLQRSLTHMLRLPELEALVPDLRQEWRSILATTTPRQTRGLPGP